ncbi:MAG: hypothetical protein JWR11_6225 [Mycobacterium sp.]|nr:hypothetical protein [Mycobacterium sp.]
MTMAPIPVRPDHPADASLQMHALVTDIEKLVTKTCDLRRLLRREPDTQLSVQALDDMIEVLGEVKLRLRVDASGNHRT